MYQKLNQALTKDRLNTANSRTAFITLEFYAKKYADRDEAIAQAHASGAYGMKEIGDHFGSPYSRGSRMLAEVRLAKGKTPYLTPKLCAKF